MGKPTGFMEYDRCEAASVEPKERIKNFNEFHVFLYKRKSAETGCPLYGLRSSFLPVGNDNSRHDIRLSSAQPGSGVERPCIYRQLGAGI